MNRLIICFLLAVASLSASAQGVREVFVSMPDSIVPYLDRSARENLVKLADVTNDTVSAVDNAIGGTSYLMHLSDDYLALQASKALTLELSLLPTEKDTLVCLLLTFDAGESESNVYLYNKVWEIQKRLDLVELLGLQQITEANNAGDVEQLIPEMKMVHATFFQDDPLTLSLACSYPLIPLEEKDKENSKKVIKMIKWDGKTFK